MKLTPIAAATLLAVPFALHAQDAPVQLKDNKDKVSYSIGTDIASTLKKQEIEINPEAFFQGIRDGLSGNKPVLAPEEMQAVMQAFQQEMMAKMAKKRQDTANANKAASEKFLAENKTKEGVKTTASGLEYKVISEGKGEKPKATDTVSVHYRGTTIDGKEFDSSYKRNEPAEFPLNGVIPGWTEGVQLMTVGSKYQFFIPSTLAYGEQAPPEIGPNQALIFEVELLGIKKPEAAATPAPEATAAPKK